MTQQHELDLILDAFFVDGTDELADRVLDAALDEIDHTHQRRRLRLPRRLQTMSMPVRLAAAAVIGVIAVGGLLLWRPFGSTVGTSPTAIPSSSPAASVEPVSSPSAFTPTAGLSGGYERLSATRLPDGRVLVVGGDGPAGSTASAELYDPETGTWSAAPNMDHDRGYPAAALAGDGRVIVSGSDDLGGPAEIFDPSTDSWAPTGPLNSNRGQPSSITLADGRVLLVGGGDTGISPSSEIFDPATERWTLTSPMVVGRANPGLALLPDDRVLVIGGFAGEQGTSQQMTCEIYDPATDTWTATSDMHQIRVFASTTTLPDGRILIVGGGGPPIAGDLYDPASGEWTATDSINLPGDYVVSVLLADGTVYVTGGAGSGAILDPGTRRWTPVAVGPSMPKIRSATPLEDGRVLIVGLNADQTASPAELFDPAALP